MASPDFESLPPEGQTCERGLMSLVPQTCTFFPPRPQTLWGSDMRHHGCVLSKFPAHGNREHNNMVVQLLRFGTIRYAEITGTPLLRMYQFFIRSTTISRTPPAGQVMVTQWGTE